MPPIYLVRHGQTDWNAAYRLQGQVDAPINETGRAQAKRNGQVLARLIGEPSRVDFVASPLGRTRETMEIIRAELGLPPEDYRTDDRLKEIHLGDWQGSTWDELRAAAPEQIEARFADPWNTVAPGDGGESYAMLAERAESWLAEVRRETVVVTHGGINRCLRGRIERLPVCDIPHLKVPQDKVLLMTDGGVDWI